VQLIPSLLSRRGRGLSLSLSPSAAPAAKGDATPPGSCPEKSCHEVGRFWPKFNKVCQNLKGEEREGEGEGGEGREKERRKREEGRGKEPPPPSSFSLPLPPLLSSLPFLSPPLSFPLLPSLSPSLFLGEIEILEKAARSSSQSLSTPFF